jgi:hypothetical protein
MISPGILLNNHRGGDIKFFSLLLVRRPTTTGDQQQQATNNNGRPTTTRAPRYPFVIALQVFCKLVIALIIMGDNPTCL